MKKQAFLILLDKIRQKKLFQLMIWVWGKKFVKLLLKNWNLALLSDCLLLSLNYRGRYRQPRSKQKQSFKFLNFIIFTALICFFNHFRSSDRRFNVPTSTLSPSNIDYVRFQAKKSVIQPARRGAMNLKPKLQFKSQKSPLTNFSYK